MLQHPLVAARVGRVAAPQLGLQLRHAHLAEVDPIFANRQKLLAARGANRQTLATSAAGADRQKLPTWRDPTPSPHLRVRRLFLTRTHSSFIVAVITLHSE